MHLENHRTCRCPQNWRSQHSWRIQPRTANSEILILVVGVRRLILSWTECKCPFWPTQQGVLSAWLNWEGNWQARDWGVGFYLMPIISLPTIHMSLHLHRCGAMTQNKALHVAIMCLQLPICSGLWQRVCCLRKQLVNDRVNSPKMCISRGSLGTDHKCGVFL